LVTLAGTQAKAADEGWNAAGSLWVIHVLEVEDEFDF
jgi:hypothetical protein